MTRPHALLGPLIRGDAVTSADVGRQAVQGLVGSAVEHRVDGLLWSRHLTQGFFAEDVARDLGHRDVVRRSFQARLMRSLEAVAGRLDALEVDWMLLKGFGTQERFYDRGGERPTGDLDVLVAPWHRHRVGEVIAALQPDHPLVDVAQRIVDDGDEQALEVSTERCVVDLHVDMLKTRLPMRGSDEVWGQPAWIDLPDGGRVRVPPTEAALLHHVVHLNKDRFRFLLGHVDVARIAPHANVETFWAMASREGLADQVALALAAVAEVVDLPASLLADHEASGWRAAVWRRAWPDHVRLSGQEAVLSYRHRQDLLALTAVGRTGEYLRERTLPRLFPPAERIDQVYPGLRGPYLWRLSPGRARAIAERRTSRKGG